MPVKKDKKTVVKKPTKKTKHNAGAIGTKVKAKAVAKSSSNVYIDMRKTTRPRSKETEPKKPAAPQFIHTTSQIPIYLPSPPTADRSAGIVSYPVSRVTEPESIKSTVYKIGHSIPIHRLPVSLGGEDIPVRVSRPIPPTIVEKPAPITIHRPESVTEFESTPIIRQGTIIKRNPTPEGEFLPPEEAQPLPQINPLALELLPSYNINYGLTPEELDMYATYSGVTSEVARNLLRRRLAERKGSPLNAPPASQRNFSLEILKRAEKKYVKQQYPEPGVSPSPRPRKKI